jgi:hypothetical protein
MSTPTTEEVVPESGESGPGSRSTGTTLSRRLNNNNNAEVSEVNNNEPTTPQPNPNANTNGVTAVVHPASIEIGIHALPPVSTFLVVLQVITVYNLVTLVFLTPALLTYIYIFTVYTSLKYNISHFKTGILFSSFCTTLLSGLGSRQRKIFSLAGKK